MIVGRYFCQLLAMCWKKVLRKQQEGFGHAGSARHVQILEKEDSSKVGRSMNLENFHAARPKLPPSLLACFARRKSSKDAAAQENHADPPFCKYR